MPLGEVGVLDRQLRQLRLASVRQRAVHLVELREQQVGGEVIGAHVVEDHEQEILVWGEVHEGGTQQDVTGERERPAAQLAQQLVGAHLRLFAREANAVGDGQIERRGVECLLDRGAVDEDKPGVEDLVPVDDALERAPQLLLLQRRPNAHERGDVVCAEPWHDSVEQEQALLWE